MTLTVNEIEMFLRDNHFYNCYNLVSCCLQEYNFDNYKVAKLLNYAVSTVKSYWYRKTRNLIEKFIAFKNKLLNKKKEKYYAYILKCTSDEYDYLFKVGYTNNINRRIKEIEKKSRFGYNYFLIKPFEFDNADDALEMEVWLHRYFRQENRQIGQDHFICHCDYTHKDFSFLDNKANEIKENSKKWLDNLKNV